MAHTRRDVWHVLCAGDIHVPYHDPFALNAFMKRMRDVEPGILVLNGDIADMLSVSLHDDGAPRPEFQAECDAVFAFLSQCRQIMGKRPIHYNCGNHEDRFRRYVDKHAPVMRGREAWHSALRLADLNITHLDYGKVHTIGKLGFTHGVYCGDSYAKQHLLRYGCSLVIGHAHRAQLHTVPVMADDGSQLVRGAFGVPCLAPVVDVSYIRGPTGHTQGWFEAYVERKTGYFTPNIVILNEQRAWIDGKCYDGRAP